MINKIIVFGVIFLSFIALHSSAQNFQVEGNSLRNCVIGNIGGKSVLYNSELDGSVSCYSLEGKKLWRNPTTTPAVMFEIVAADVNADGKDDLLAASGDGNIYCWDSKGTLLWKFSSDHKVRFSEVAALKTKKGIQIFAGGNDFTLYELNGKGALISKTPIKGVVRKIEVGNFLQPNEPSIFVMTYTHDKFNWEFMAFLNPQTKQVLKSFDNKTANSKTWSGFMLTDMSVVDIDKDQRDDLLFFGSKESAAFIALNSDFKEIAIFKGGSKEKQRYAHTTGACLLPNRNEIVMQFGGVLYVCDLKGKLLQQSGVKNKGIIYNDLAFDPLSGKLFGGGQVGGGNGIYSYLTQNENWWKTEHQLIGRMKDVETNLETLYKQTLKFTLPTYQKPSEKEWVMIGGPSLLPEVDKLKGAKMKLVKQYTWHENFDRANLVKAIGKDALKRDKRGDYSMTRDAMLKIATDNEANKVPFAVWTGHGTDPFYVSLETMLAILKAAPTMCYGFIYAEMENTEDKRFIYFVDNYIPELAEACRKQGNAKLYFRYKSIFWAASAHLEPWKRIFFSGKYSDVLVPSAEDTNSRTQDLNFTGRVGMFASGSVDNFAMRLVEDNPTSWRPLSPGGQRSVSPYLRNGAIMAAYGSRYGLIFNIAYIDNPGMNILYALMKSGVLPIVERENILSIGSWHLIKDADEKLIDDISNGHDITLYTPNDEDAVFSVAEVNWSGTSLPDHDYSKAALGVDYRWLNFMPKMPNGMVPIVPSSYEPTLAKQAIPYFVSNCKAGFVDGKTVAAKEFGSTIKSTVARGAAKLPVLVEGASWSAIKIDDNHTRIILVDPGYIDPQDCKVTVRFNTKQPVSATDILSKENLKISDKSIQLIVPAGSMRFIDLKY